jgi:tripartite ATP-independent transporter DctP family solute receptor
MPDNKEKTMQRRSFLATSAALAACLSFAAGGALAQNYRAEYRLSTVLGTAFPWGQAGERWAELVKEKTQGRINIKMYPGTSLVGGDQTREFTAIRQGVIDLAIGSTINWSPQVKELNLFSLPFLMPDYKAIDALTQGEVGQQLFKVLEQREVVPLAWGENGFREMSNSKRPVASPADMKGFKFRVVGSPLYNETFTALGANPTQMSWADAQPALASGAVDGQENQLSVFVAAKLPTVGQKHLTLWHYVADPLIFVVNKEVWASWTPADQEAVRQAALQAGKENVAKARQGIAGSDNAVLKQIEAAGVTVTHLSDEQRAAFVKATRPVYDKWSKTIGADLVKKAETAISKR